MTLHELIVQIARALVNHPERVKLESHQEDGKVAFRLFVDPEDVGQIIGKDGRLARCFRTIVGAASTKLKHRVSLEIMNRLDPRQPDSSVASLSEAGITRPEEEPR